MNRSILQELIDAAKEWDDDIAIMYGITSTFDPEELVRLAVAECVKVCKENNAFVAADRIKKHFGITD